MAGALVRRGVTPAAALAFLLSAPAIDPIVLTATAVAFPNDPRWSSPVSSRACWWPARWAGCGSASAAPTGCARQARAAYDGQSKGAAFWGSVRHDVMHAGGFLVVGAMAVATLKAVVPEEWLRMAAGNPVVSVLALAVLAVLLSICSEADAFVAASLWPFSLTAQLVAPGRRPDGRPEAVRDAGGHLRPRLRPAVRAHHLRPGGHRGGPDRGGAPVNRQAQAAVLFLLGAALLHAGLTDLYLRYVKAGLRPMLLASGII
ncbi:hypothetical protein SALBM311S_05013 [Streptomyces alboniger]